MFRDYPDVVTAEQMCQMLGGISIKTGYELLRTKKIKSFTVGRSYRIPKAFILEYMGI
ncbi:MAG: helix-turn-helix domain-containing protein [Candidatus Faecousia sp.]|nr:helix-turn-helix domain-containing protein [Clostridiales bacterium]MDY2809953.1 helix-turn-helix domain-containing protein [Candidatus Faecousia sp.]